MPSGPSGPAKPITERQRGIEDRGGLAQPMIQRVFWPAQRGGRTIGKLGRHCHGFALHCLVRHRHRDETHRVCFLAAECISDTNQGPSASMTLPSSKPVR
ncbi:hypothetical protein M527_15200 [Sphingobium indicum IP26]|nr:hypothetical protein M527_15200 [Sphingobium indicum IP26]